MARMYEDGRFNDLSEPDLDSAVFHMQEAPRGLPRRPAQRVRLVRGDGRDVSD
jgi:hypothetical protein